MTRLPEDSQTVSHSVDAALGRQHERRRQVRGLLLLALVAIVFAVLRAGVPRVFTVGWWRLW